MIGMTEIFAVVGNPALHSKSPQMLNAAFVEKKIDAIYTRMTAETAEEVLETAKAVGMRALNVTTPFKEEMAKLVELDEIAEKLGAVNTILLEKNGKVIGTNTDSDGVAGALKSEKMNGRKAIVLGAGGAAKAAVIGLLSLGAKVTVVNRTVEKAEAIGKKFGCQYAPLAKLADVLEDNCVIVSALSTYARVVEPKLLRKDMVILDANYAGETALVKDAKVVGCRTMDGKEWLINHGLKAFKLFTGKIAPGKVMLAAIEAEPKHKTNIALIGMMGSGKTKISAELAKLTGMEIFDSDQEIEKQAGQKIARIFEENGEKKFRKMETEQMKRIDGMENRIIACGGGLILNPKNIEILRKSATVIWLWANPETIEKRVAGSERPLLNVAERSDAIKKILEKRKALYAKAADLIVSTENRTPKQIAERILNENNARKN